MNNKYQPLSEMELLKYKGTAETPDIKIFISHRIDLDSATIPSSIFVPVRSGAVFDKQSDPPLPGDDTGENISEKNRSFCELTAQYWAWKNIKADYYGLFHYRRFLNFSGYDFDEDAYGNVIEGPINEVTTRLYGLSDACMRELITKYDIVLPKKQNIKMYPEKWKSHWEHWSASPVLQKEDLETLLTVVSKVAPDYYDETKAYLDGHEGYFCLMHIMKREIFEAYCSWLYPILFELEKTIDISRYSIEGQRVIGHLAERLFGVYIMRLKRTRPDLRIKELQTVLFQQPDALPEMLPRAFASDNTVPVAFAANEQFAPVCAVALQSLICHASSDRNYDIVILESDITKKDKALIQSMAEGKNNISIRFFNASQAINKYDLQANMHITVETFYRFLIQDILPDYDKVLYLDGDLVCQRDVGDLYETDVEGFLLAAARDPDMCGQLNLDPLTLRYLWEEVHMDSPYDYFQAGVLVLNLKEMRAAFTLHQWLTFCQTKYRYSDQDVLNRYCQGRVRYLDMAWNMLIECNDYRVAVVIKAAPADTSREYQEARANPFVIHFAGFQKPWNMKNVDFEELFWRYARMTPFYERLLLGLIQQVAPVVASASAEPSIGVKGALIIYFKKHLPKWMHPFAKKIKHLLRW